MLYAKKETWALPVDDNNDDNNSIVAVKMGSQVQVVIADSENESACSNVSEHCGVTAPVTTVPFPAALLDLLSTVNEYTGKDSNSIRIAFVERDSMDNAMLASTLMKLKDMDAWHTLAFCNHGGVAND